MNKIPFSQALRLGSHLRPRGENDFCYRSGEDSNCAVEAALESVGLERHRYDSIFGWCTYYTKFESEWPYLVVNNVWSRSDQGDSWESIAQWAESIEREIPEYAHLLKVQEEAPVIVEDYAQQTS